MQGPSGVGWEEAGKEAGNRAKEVCALCLGQPWEMENSTSPSEPSNPYSDLGASKLKVSLIPSFIVQMLAPLCNLA